MNTTTNPTRDRAEFDSLEAQATELHQQLCHALAALQNRAQAHPGPLRAHAGSLEYSNAKARELLDFLNGGAV